MRTLVSVPGERQIDASSDAVWSVVSDPAMHERLDPRCRLESTSGDAGQVGSEYVLVVKAGRFTKVRLRYVVVESEPNSRLVANVSRSGRQQGEQRAELSPDGLGTNLRWTVSVSVPSFTARLAARASERQLTEWLAAVEREAVRMDS